MAKQRPDCRAYGRQGERFAFSEPSRQRPEDLVLYLVRPSWADSDRTAGNHRAQLRDRS